MNRILTSCRYCNEPYTVNEVNDNEIANLLNGMDPQQALPHHTPNDWQMLNTRTCPLCAEHDAERQPDNDDDNYPIEPTTTEDSTPEPPNHKCLDCDTMISHKRKYCDNCSVPF